MHRKNEYIYYAWNLLLLENRLPKLHCRLWEGSNANNLTAIRTQEYVPLTRDVCLHPTVLKSNWFTECIRKVWNSREGRCFAIVPEEMKDFTCLIQQSVFVHGNGCFKLCLSMFSPVLRWSRRKELKQSAQGLLPSLILISGWGQPRGCSSARDARVGPDLCYAGESFHCFMIDQGWREPGNHGQPLDGCPAQKISMIALSFSRMENISPSRHGSKHK